MHEARGGSRLRAPMSLRRRRLQSFAFLGIVAGFSLSAHRVKEHADAELRHVSASVRLGEVGEREGATEISSRLTHASLVEGELSTFELCADDEMRDPAWRDAFLVLVWAPETQTLGLRIPLDDAHLALARRSAGRACLPLGGGRVPVSDRFVVDLVHQDAPIPEALHDVRVSARIFAQRPLGLVDALGGVLILLGASALLVSWLVTPCPSSTERPLRPHRALMAVAFGLALVLAAFELPSVGPLAVMGRGALVALLQIGIAFAAGRALSTSPRSALALHAPERNVGPALVFAVAAGGAAYVAARLLLATIPSTGEAPITTFVAWSSGALSFATLGLLTPVAEEIFFRGFVFKALGAFGKVAAVLGSAATFALLHLAQTHGNWGAFASIAVAGLVFSILRALTGTTVAPAFAHLGYNALLSLSAFD